MAKCVVRLVPKGQRPVNIKIRCIYIFVPEKSFSHGCPPTQAIRKHGNGEIPYFNPRAEHSKSREPPSCDDDLEGKLRHNKPVVHNHIEISNLSISSVRKRLSLHKITPCQGIHTLGDKIIGLEVHST
ncbi:unnamed protein product [Dovyalis caffra]|uniref:Uncharacterized protein n=1 Tax=Dovyalis caffra TaxID=77055 RepID=A0AAV1SVF6_9ROSI|nr:unnamed protein product [Dovyalis caffra]